MFDDEDNKEDTTVRIVTKMDSGFLVKEYSKRKLIKKGISSMVLPLILESKWTYYYAQTGSIRTENYYEGNQLLKNRNWKNIPKKKPKN